MSTIGRPYWFDRTYVPDGLYPDHDKKIVNEYDSVMQPPPFITTDEIEAFVSFWESDEGQKIFQQWKDVRLKSLNQTLYAQSVQWHIPGTRPGNPSGLISLP